MLSVAMLSFVKFILLLLSSLPSTLSAPPGLVNFTDKRIACQQSTSFHRFLFFSAAADTTFHYGIKTGYTGYYPSALDSALRLNDFHPLPLDNPNACGWHKVRAVHHAGTLPIFGANRGEIYWKYVDVIWVSSKDPKLPAHWEFAFADHKPPHVSALPPNATLDKIAQILKDNEPAADVFQLTTICLGYFSGLLGVLLIINLVLRYLDVTKSEDTDDIELAAIRVNGLDKPSTASASTDAIATAQSSSDSVREVASGQSTPPPQYSPRGPSGCIRGGDALSRLREAYGVNVRRPETTASS
jgi:hypothetical protein